MLLSLRTAIYTGSIQLGLILCLILSCYSQAQTACLDTPPSELVRRYAEIRRPAPHDMLLGDATLRLESMIVDLAACESSFNKSDCSLLDDYGLQEDSLLRRCRIFSRFASMIQAFSYKRGGAAECDFFFSIARPNLADLDKFCRDLELGFPNKSMTRACHQKWPDSQQAQHCVHWFADTQADCSEVVDDTLSRIECLRNARVTTSLHERRNHCRRDEAFCAAVRSGNLGGCRNEALAVRKEYCRQEPLLRAYATRERK